MSSDPLGWRSSRCPGTAEIRSSGLEHSPGPRLWGRFFFFFRSEGKDGFKRHLKTSLQWGYYIAVYYADLWFMIVKYRYQEQYLTKKGWLQKKTDVAELLEKRPSPLIELGKSRCLDAEDMSSTIQTWKRQRPSLTTCWNPGCKLSLTNGLHQNFCAQSSKKKNFNNFNNFNNFKLFQVFSMVFPWFSHGFFLFFFDPPQPFFQRKYFFQELDGPIPWDTLLFVIGHINYGGRVTDDNDRPSLTAFLWKLRRFSKLENFYVTEVWLNWFELYVPTVPIEKKKSFNLEKDSRNGGFICIFSLRNESASAVGHCVICDHIKIGYSRYTQHRPVLIC